MAAQEREPDREAVMSFGDHLDELRRRVFRAAIVPLPLAILAFYFADRIRAVLEHPLRVALKSNEQTDQLQSLGVTETMGVDIKLSLVIALVVSSPWILWQVWKFVEPGLYEHERRFARMLIPGSILLTIGGVLTLYFIMLPFSLDVLVNYGVQDRSSTPPAMITEPLGPEVPAFPLIPLLDEAPKEVRPGQAFVLLPRRLLCVPISRDGKTIEILTMALTKDSAYMQVYRLSEYHDFVLLLMLGVAVAFQMPLVILLLGWVGILRIDTLRKNRKYAFFLMTIISAIVTPTTDLTSMLLMLVPLYLLYELGIILLVLVPPGALSEGSVMTGLFRRIREARSSGKRTVRPVQSERSARPAHSEESDRQRTAPRRREPDGDADERDAGSGPS